LAKRTKSRFNVSPATGHSVNSFMDPFAVRLKFRGDLSFFLKAKNARAAVERVLAEKSSVKDVIESCGVPHPEVDLILVEGQPVDFHFRLDRSCRVEIFPVSLQPDLFPGNRLQTRHLTKFLADGHLGKLVRDLRLLGFDVLYDCHADDRQLLELAGKNDRALLTRDRRLLMHAVVRHGYYLRSQKPLEQTVEVIRRFDLGSLFAPFTRCLRCNGPLQAVSKTQILERLEPLTKIYYEQFRRCAQCGQIYWAGSHFARLEKRLNKIRSQCL